MSDKTEKSAKRFSRRNFLAGAAAMAAMRTPILKTAATVLPDTVTIDNEAVWDAFFDDARYKAISTWLTTLREFELGWIEDTALLNVMKTSVGALAEKDIQKIAMRIVDFNMYKRDCGYYNFLNIDASALIEQAPTKETIAECLEHPVFKQLYGYDEMPNGRPVGALVQEVHSLAHDPGKMQSLIDARIDHYYSITDALESEATRFPEIVEEIKTLKKIHAPSAASEKKEKLEQPKEKQAEEKENLRQEIEKCGGIWLNRAIKSKTEPSSQAKR